MKLKRNQQGFHHLGILLILVVIGVIGLVGYRVLKKSHGGSSIFEGSKPKGLNLVKGERVDNQGCKGTGPVEFGASPIDTKDINVILPYGGAVGAHVTPIDHMYIWAGDRNTPRDAYEVRAMADGLVTAMSERKQQVSDTNNGAVRPAEYQLKFWYTCDFASYYDLLTSLSPRLMAEFEKNKQGGGYSNVQIPVKEGEVIGRIGAQTLDFAVYDYTKILPGFIVPEHYLAESWKLHVVDPFQYFKEPIKSELLAKNVRQAEPRAGKIDYDQDGKLIGTWFKEGNNGFGDTGGQNPSPWRAHLSLFPNYIDPSLLIISIGDYGGKSEQFAVKANGPDPATIDQSSGVIKFELTQVQYWRRSTGQNWDNFHVFTDIYGKPGTVVKGTVLAQLTSQRKLKFEAFPNKTADQVTAFTPAAITYER